MSTIEGKMGIATITWARSPSEGRTILNSLRCLSSVGLPIIVTDGGSPLSFIEELRSIPHVFLTSATSKGGLFPQIKKSLTEATRRGCSYIFYTEANKLDFFQKGLSEFLSQADTLIQSRPNTGLVVAARTPSSFSTFPPFQRLEEEMTNQLLRYFLNNRQEIDYAYGPRIINTSLISTLDKAPDNVGWGWLSFILLANHTLGKEVHAVPLDLPCPENEREETENDKLYRLAQFNNHVNALHLALSTEF